MKIFWVAGFLALAAAGVWGEDKAKEEKKEEPAGLSQEENIKVVFFKINNLIQSSPLDCP